MTDRPKLRYKRPWDRASQDKRKRAARLASREPFIYFFACREFVKIGWSTDPAQRLSAVQVSNPDPVTLVALISGGEREEAALHSAFKTLYHRAEWYRAEGRLAELITLISGRSPAPAREI